MKPIQARVAAAVADLKTSYSVSSRKLQALMTDMERDISGGTRLPVLGDNSEDKAGDEQSLATASHAICGSDMWLSIRAYKSAVIELSHNIQLLHIRESKLREQKRTVTQRLKLLFVATTQLFVHERSRIFTDSAEYLENKKREVMQLKLSQSAKAPPVEAVSDTNGEQASSVSGKTAAATQDNSASALPNGSGQILMQSIMQITTLENARSYGKEKSDRRGSFLGGMLGAVSESVPTDLISAKVVATTDGLLHIFLMEGAQQSSSQLADKPYRSLILEVKLKYRIAA
jgi:hypothetical protein